MKRFLFVGVLLAAFGLFPSTASALSYTQTFCSATSNPVGESASCNVTGGLGAKLTVTDVGTDAGDDNDFFVFLELSTLAADGFNTATYTGIESVQFDTDFKTTDFESAPTVDDSGVSGGGSVTWVALFGSLQQCPSGNANDKSVCSKISTGGTTSTGDVDVWKFYVNFDDELTIDEPFTVNMRAAFFPSHNLSPEGKIIDEGSSEEGTSEEGTSEEGTSEEGTSEEGTSEEGSGTAVPEPASLLLLGSGLAMGAARLRRQKK